ncbi:MAG: hypothetical protein QM610_09510 [Chitinophagaceae bacterium]
MMKRMEVENIISELRQLGCVQLAGLRDVNPYQKPTDAYFESNMERVVGMGMLFPYHRDNVFDVADGYFEAVATYLESTVMQEMLVPCSFEIEKIDHPFTVPENYFETIRPDLLIAEEQVIEQKIETKVHSLFRRFNQYVAAAAVLLLFSLGANILLHVKEEKKAYQVLNNMDINEELADVPTEEIFNYLNQSASKNMDYLINNNGEKNNLVNQVMYGGDHSRNHSQNVSDREILELLSEEDPGF